MARQSGTAAPREGGYGQYCPISRAVEVLGERWSLLIVRDMLCGYTRFNDLARGNPGLS
ncbi:MAG: winged helix-turn-helix transcriptional regulator, partial [Acidimicrobiia bacterium]|nr:winged helix-turn-helix transcriptional regulator [Acidimicrobiia bacterium]